MNGYIGNWLLGQSSSPDSVISSLFFGEPDYSSYSGWSSHRDGLFPFEAIGSAVDFASRVAEELQEGNGVQAALTGGQRDGSSYRILGRRSKKTRQRSKTQELALRFRRGVEHVLLGISMTSIGSFLWMLISLPLLCVGICFYLPGPRPQLTALLLQPLPPHADRSLPHSQIYARQPRADHAHGHYPAGTFPARWLLEESAHLLAAYSQGLTRHSDKGREWHSRSAVMSKARVLSIIAVQSL